MLEHGASANRYLETAGRLISDYLVDEVDDSSSRPFVADALSWCSTNQPARTRPARTSLARRCTGLPAVAAWSLPVAWHG